MHLYVLMYFWSKMQAQGNVLAYIWSVKQT